MRRAAHIAILSLVLCLFVSGCGCSRQQEAVSAPADEPAATAPAEDAPAPDETAATASGEQAPTPYEETPGSAGDSTDPDERSSEPDPAAAALPDEEPEASAPDAEEAVDEDSVDEAVNVGVEVGAATLDELIDWGVSTWGTLSGTASEQLEARRSAVPTHASLGDEVVATENLSVSVVSVEPGPYDHLDQTETTKVTVRMHNTSDHTVTVKASNWDADNARGLRVDHKYVVMDEGNHIVAQSFTVATISPGATYEAVVYFDGELVSVIYEPHWLVSAENEYIYFDL